MDKEFISKVDTMFKETLNYVPRNVIRVKNIRENKILGLNDINYSKLRFDAQLNMYKFDESGDWVLVNNENFKPIIAEE